MIRAAEASGAMSEMLERIVEHYERVNETRDKIVGAMIYPAIVILALFVTVAIAMIWIIPNFRKIFNQVDKSLPLLTRMVIGANQWLIDYGLFVLAGIGLAVFLIRRALKTKKGRRVMDMLILRTPIVRGIVAAGIYANFARTLGTLLKNGVPVLSSLEIVEKTVHNTVIQDELRNARNRVTDGHSISGPLAKGKIFPRMMTDMLAIGEETGDISGALSHVAKRYENQLSHNLKILTTALEPLVICVLVVLVGLFAAALLLPVWDFTTGMGM